MMQQPRQPTAYPLRDLVGSALNGSLVLPEFQRDFVWKPAAVNLLLSSVAMDWPIGSFMIWQPAADDFQMAAKAFDGIPLTPPLPDQSFLLDGQQRLTSLIHALMPDRSSHKYMFERLHEFLLKPEAPDIEDHLRAVTSKQFGKSYASLQERAAQDAALISDITDKQKFDEWTRYFAEHHPDDEEPQWWAMRDARLPGFNSYSVPCVLLQPSLELEAVARIFETTNKTGIKLGTVDLMTAKLYPAQFRLRDEWEAVLDERSETMRHFSETLDAEDVLRVLAFWHSNRSGVTRDRILRLPPTYVKAHWQRAVACVCKALSFLSQRCGVIQGSLLPARLMVLPIAVAFDELSGALPEVEQADDALERWFWRAVVEESFVRSTNTRAVIEAKGLLASIERGELGALRKAALGEDSKAAVRERLLDPRGADGVLEAAVMAMVVARGGQDWRHGERRLEECSGELTKHHVVPRKGAGVDNWELVNCIANLTPQSMESNRELGNDLPVDAEVSGAVADAHFCDVAELGGQTVATFNRFVERRAGDIADAMVKLSSGGPDH